MPILLKDSPGYVVQEVLINNGLGADPDLVPIQAWPVYSGNEPSEPDNCITVYATIGKDDGRTMKDGETLNHYGIQIRVRSVDDPTGVLKMEAIKAFLQQLGRGTVLINGNAYYVPSVSKIGQVLYIGVDGPNTNRSLFTLNCITAIRPL